MTQNWDEPDQTTIECLMLEAEAAHDLSGLWSLVKAAQQATLRIALDPMADPDLSMTQAAMESRLSGGFRSDSTSVSTAPRVSASELLSSQSAS